MIRLIASDMDGTLLGSKMNVSEENVKAIRYAEEHGVTFMIATGRGYTEAVPPLKEAGLTCPIITVNGSQMFDKDGEELFTINIENQEAQAIIDIFTRHNIYFEVATDHGIYSTSQPQRIENAAAMLANRLPHLTFKMAVAMAAAHLELLEITYIDSYQELVEHPEIKILKFIAFSEDGQKVLRPAREETEKLKNIVATSSFPNNIEINHQLAQKGIAVAHVAKQMGIPMEQVMTIGDNFNDVSMLENTGVSFAMGNAEQGVKDVAKYVTDINTEGGVGKAIIRAIDENL